jgi:hypothetical protein
LNSQIQRPESCQSHQCLNFWCGRKSTTQPYPQEKGQLLLPPLI